MFAFGITLGVLALLTVLVPAAAYICFRLAFYADRKKAAPQKEYDILSGGAYDVYRDKMIAWQKETRAYPHEDFYIKSHDGLTLHGAYYESRPGAPIEIMFHGYRGTAERDLCGGMQRCFSLGRNALIIDQRAAGQSEGNVISFGINESRDCLAWVDFTVEHFGSSVKLILCGISMGAATVTIAAGCDLPENVVGVLADCGYSSAKAIIKLAIRGMGLPPALYPLVRLGAYLYGHFDPDSTAPIEAAARARVPIIFIHGEDDGFVPCYMSRENHAACVSRKFLFTVPGADHGLSYLVDPEGYIAALRKFFPDWSN